MNAKSLTIGGAFTAVIAGVIYKYGELVTDGFLLLTALVLTLVIVSYGVSWSATQAYKVLNFKRSTLHKELVKRKLYRFAIGSGALTMLACGSVFLLAGNLAPQEKIVVGVFWLLACAFVGLTSPFLWRWTFEKLLPRFNRYVSGKPEPEHEALDRPSEVPRE
jgi:hypothetical protein